MRERIIYYPITQGHIIATWHILFLVFRYDSISPKNVINIAIQSGKLGGSSPAKQGLKLCLDYGLVCINKEMLALTEISKVRIINQCNDEDPNIDVLRALLFHFISYHNFQWLIFYDTDAEIFRESLFANDPEWTNLLDNAKLFDFEDEDVNKWWDRVLIKYEDYKEKLKKKIGDVGEKLTYNHELQRLENDGYKPSKSYVKWASRISDRFGYDVLSIRSKYFLDSNDERDKIQIEVKSSDTFNVEAFRFFISKPEWETALNNINSYFFFCWTCINIENETAKGPYIIPASDLLSSVPVDVSKICEWSECRCIIDVSKYGIQAKVNEN